jgi:hypothetical protein
MLYHCCTVAAYSCLCQIEGQVTVQPGPKNTRIFSGRLAVKGNVGYGVVQKNVNLGAKNEFSFLDLVE